MRILDSFSTVAHRYLQLHQESTSWLSSGFIWRGLKEGSKSLFQAVVGVLNFWKVLDEPQVGGRNILTMVTPLDGHGPYTLGL